MTILLLALALLVGEQSAASSTPPDGSLRVATFNIRYGLANDGENRWELRRELAFRTISEMDPDLIGMQEVLAFQFDELRKAFPAYEFVGVGRNDGKRGGEFVPVAFKSKKFEKVAEGHFWLSEQPDTPGSKGWDAALPRMATWVRLKDRETMQDLLFVNTHFDHKGKKAREESARLLRTRVEQLMGSRPAIVVGDFNATEDDRPYGALVGKADGAFRLIDSFRAVHVKRMPGEGTAHEFSGNRDRGRIDWILHSAQFESSSCEIVYTSQGKRFPSDHFPVLAVLKPAEGKQ